MSNTEIINNPALSGLVPATVMATSGKDAACIQNRELETAKSENEEEMAAATSNVVGMR